MSQALRAWWIGRRKRPLLEARHQHAALAFLGVFLVVGVLVVAFKVNAAGPLESLGKWALVLFGKLLLAVISFLGNLIIILVNGLIGIAQYNDFVRSEPVTTGWPLVRDVVNMFFIVVLLLSAFSTIIGYREFHYTKILPKLLLMAILINFSKTLLGLLIDFSQVLVLTFVNAFKQAAGGNFVTAMHLNQILSLQSQAEEGLGEIIGSLLLGVLLLGIMLSLILIMIAFMMFRIVGLWILLILSPIAFFALSVSGTKLQKGLSAFTNDFWDRLTTLLVAGPVMVFFLWLSLAIASKGVSGFQLIGDAEEANKATAAANFSSAVGNPADITSFIVAVALMLQGVEFGLKSSKALGSALLNSITGAVSPTRLPGTIGRITGYGLRGADALTGRRLSQATGRAGLALGRVPLVGGVFGLGAGQFAKLAARRPQRLREIAAEHEKLRSSLAPRDRELFDEVRSRSLTPSVAQAARISMGNRAMIPSDRKALTNQMEEQIRSKNSGMDKSEILVRAEFDMKQAAGERIKVAREDATAMGDDALVDRFDEQLKKNPSFRTDWKDMRSIFGLSVDKTNEKDLGRYFGQFQADALKDSRSAIAILKQAGVYNENGALQTDSVGYRYMEKHGGDEFAYLKQHQETMTDAERRAHIEAVRTGAAADVAAANNSRSYASKDADGKLLSVLVNNPAAGFRGDVRLVERARRDAEAGIAAIRTQAEQERSQAEAVRVTAEAARVTREVAEVRAAETAGNAAQAQTQRLALLGQGISVSQVNNFNVGSGEFASVDAREGFEGDVAAISQRLARGDEEVMNLIRGLNLDALKERPGDYNEARSSLVATADVNALRSGYERAKRENNEQAAQKIADIFSVILAEANRLKKEFGKAKLTPAQIEEVALRPTSADSTRYIEQIVERGGAETELRAVEAARAMHAGRTVRTADELRAVRGAIDPRALRVAQARGNGRQRRQDQAPDNDDD